MFVELETLLANDMNVQILEDPSRFKAPIQAWFKHHQQLPLEILLSVNRQRWQDDLEFPSRTQYDELFHQYFSAVHPIASLFPERYFYQRTELYRSQIGSDQRDTQSHQALMLAVAYAAAISLPLLQSQRVFGMPKKALIRSLKTKTEHCLGCLDLLGEFKLEAFQAVCIYLVGATYVL